MDGPVALITGAGGEMGRLLVPELRRRGMHVVALDVVPLPVTTREQCHEALQGSILDIDLVRSAFERFRPERVFHLAAILSSKAERDPDLAHEVNVEGTYNLFRMCKDFPPASGAPTRMLFPSSIAVYGMPDLDRKMQHGAVREPEWTVPAGMYGCNKHYCELVGAYLSRRRADGEPVWLDFRAIRFPGLISAETLPTGGTTDYAPEMIHAAAQGKPYSCFVREDSCLPFMTMPDAIDAFLLLADADVERLSGRVFNIRGFAATAGQLVDELRRHFPDAEVGFDPNPRRQAIVDSWPSDVDDAAARRDWGLAPRHDLRSALEDYLIPALRRRYGGS